MSGTKEQILEKTFILLSESEFCSISLAGIAAKVGISKTAIYRHFKSKEDLFEQLKELFFDELALVLRGFDFSKEKVCAHDLKKGLFYKLICFFAKKPEYLDYLLISLSSSGAFEQEIIVALHKRGIQLQHPQNIKKEKPHNLQEYVHVLYVLATSVYFINEKKFVAPSLDETVFAQNMCDFVFTGWKALDSISEARMSQIDLIAHIQKDELPEENRVFSALSEVINEEGFSGITIEKLSAQMGLAKSSVYTYFSNKHEMLSQFVIDEVLIFTQLLKKRQEKVKNLSEAVYMHLQTVMSYLLQRQSFIAVFEWLRRNGVVMRDKLVSAAQINETGIYMTAKRPNFGYDVSAFSISGWISTLPVSILIQCRFHHFNNEQLFDSVRQVYEFMKDGFSHIEKEYYEQENINGSA